MEHKISKLAIKEIQDRLDMLNKSHPPGRYKAISGKNKEECLVHFDPDARVSLSLAIDTRYNFVTNFCQ